MKEILGTLGMPISLPTKLAHGSRRKHKTNFKKIKALN